MPKKVNSIAGRQAVGVAHRAASWSGWLISCLLASLTQTAGQTPSDLLAQIRDKMALNLSQVPNYTCVETIERSERPSPKKKFELLDKVRLEVALVEGKELLSWPGAGKFEERSAGELMGGGTASTGDYALHAEVVFKSREPTFQFAGEEQLGGRRVVRFDYNVALEKSGYQIRTGDKHAKVPYHGSFWADRASLELVRLDVIADKIPAELEVAQTATEIDYGRVRVGQSDFLLPQQVDLVLRRTDGIERRNRTGFANCRQYVGESVITFDDPSPDTWKGPPQEIELPAGLELEVRLAATINFNTAVVGDQITAVVQSAVKRDGITLVPKGAIAHGRLRQLLKVNEYVAIGIEMFEVDFENKKAPVACKLGQAGPIPGATPRSLVLLQQDNRKRIGEFLVQTARIGALPAGFHMVWVTLPPSK